MAEADRKVRITIETKGDPKGAQAVAKALGDIAYQTDKIGVEQIAFYDLDAAIRKTTPSVEALDAVSKKTVTTKRNLGAAVQQAGYQIGDFAVQVSGGTSALTALAQQGSQVLGVLGPKGAIAGALLAVGVAAYKAFSDSEKSAKQAREEAELLADAIEATKDFAKEMADEGVDFQIDALREAATEAGKLRDAFNDTVKAQGDYDKSAVANIEKVRLAMVEVARLRGEEIDQIAELQKQQHAAAEARNLQATQEIEAENRRVEKARLAEESAKKELQDSQALQVNRAADIEFFSEQIRLLKERKKLLEETAKQVNISDVRGAGPGARPSITPTTAALSAQKELSSTPFATQISQYEGFIEQFTKALDAQGEITQQVTDATAALEDAQRETMDAATSAGIKIDEIRETLVAADLVAKAETLKQVNDTAIQTVQDVAAKAEATTEAQKEAKATIDKALSDGILTAEESRAVSHALGILIGGIKTGQTETLETLKSAKAAMDSYWQELHRLHVEFDGLKQRVGTPIK